MGIEFEYHEYGENICTTPAGDIPAKHLGNGRFDMCYQVLESDMKPLTKVMRVIHGLRNSERNRSSKR